MIIKIYLRRYLPFVDFIQQALRQKLSFPRRNEFMKSLEKSGGLKYK